MGWTLLGALGTGEGGGKGGFYLDPNPPRENVNLFYATTREEAARLRDEYFLAHQTGPYGLQSFDNDAQKIMALNYLQDGKLVHEYQSRTESHRTPDAPFEWVNTFGQVFVTVDLSTHDYTELRHGIDLEKVVNTTFEGVGIDVVHEERPDGTAQKFTLTKGDLTPAEMQKLFSGSSEGDEVDVELIPDPDDAKKLKFKANLKCTNVAKHFESVQAHIMTAPHDKADGCYLNQNLNLETLGTGVLKGKSGISVEYIPKAGDELNKARGEIVISGGVTGDTIKNADETHPEFEITHDPDNDEYSFAVDRIHGSNLTKSFKPASGDVVTTAKGQPKQVVRAATHTDGDGLETTYFVAADDGFRDGVYESIKPSTAEGHKSALKYGKGIKTTDTGAEGGEQYVTIDTSRLGAATMTRALVHPESFFDTSLETPTEANAAVKYTFKRSALAEAMMTILKKGDGINIEKTGGEATPLIVISATGGGGPGTITAGQLQALVDQSGDIRSKVVGNAVTFNMDRASLKEHIWISPAAGDAHNPIFVDSTSIKFMPADDKLALGLTDNALEPAYTLLEQGTADAPNKVHVRELVQGPGTLLVPDEADKTKVVIHSTANLKVTDTAGTSHDVTEFVIEDPAHTVAENKLFINAIKAVDKDNNPKGAIRTLKAGKGITFAPEPGISPDPDFPQFIKINATNAVAAQIDGVAGIPNITKIRWPLYSGEFVDADKTLVLNGTKADAGGAIDSPINHIKVNHGSTDTSKVKGNVLEINIPAAGGGGGTPSPSTIEVGNIGATPFNAAGIEFDAGLSVGQRTDGDKVRAVIKHKGIIVAHPEGAAGHQTAIDVNYLKIEGDGIELTEEKDPAKPDSLNNIAHVTVKTSVKGDDVDGRPQSLKARSICFDNEHFVIEDDAGMANVRFKHNLDAVDLGMFEGQTAMLEAAKKVKVAWKKGNVTGYVRRASTLYEDTTTGFTLWVWNQVTLNPTPEEIGEPTHWLQIPVVSRDYSTTLLGKGTLDPDWRPESDALFPANKHKGQTVWYTGTTVASSPYQKEGFFFSDGNAWNSLSTGASMGIVGFNPEGVQTGATANKIGFGKNLIANPKTIQGVNTLEIDSRGMTVAVKDSATDGLKEIHHLQFENAEVTPVEGFEGLANIRVTSGAINVSNTDAHGVTTEATDISKIKFKNAVMTNDTHDGSVTISPAVPIDETFIGMFNQPATFLAAAKKLNIPFKQFQIAGMVRRKQSGHERVIGYDLWYWNKTITNPTPTQIGDETNWERVLLSAHGQGVLHLGAGSIYEAWTPEDPTTYPATNAPGQIIWYTNAGAGHGHYYSDGANWRRLSTGGTGGHLTITGFKEDETTTTTIDDVTNITFTGGFIKGTAGSNLELVSGIHAEIKKSKSDPATPGTATHWQETIKTIEINGDTSMFNYDAENHALNMLLWNTAAESSLNELKAEHPPASNPWRLGFAHGNVDDEGTKGKTLHIVDRTTEEWLTVGRSGLPSQVDLIEGRYPEIIADQGDAYVQDQHKKLEYTFVNKTIVNTPTGEGGLGLINADQGFLHNIYGGEGQRWRQVFYEATTNNVWTRYHTTGTALTSWSTWAIVAGISDSTYSILVIDNDKTLADLGEGTKQYEVPYMLHTDPEANIIFNDAKNGAFRVRKGGKYNLSCISQFTWEPSKAPAETPAATDAAMELHENGRAIYRMRTADNIYNAAKKEFYPVQGKFRDVELKEGADYTVHVTLTNAATDERKIIQFDPFKNILAIDPSTSTSKSAERIQKTLYRSLGGISFQTGTEVRTEPSGGSIRVFGEEYLTTIKQLNKVT